MFFCNTDFRSVIVKQRMPTRGRRYNKKTESLPCPAFQMILTKLSGIFIPMKKKPNSDKPESYKPDWAPEENNEAFAVKVVTGIESSHDGLPGHAKPALHHPSKKRAELSVEDHVSGVLANDRTVLARTITLIESNASAHVEKAQAVLNQLLPHSGKSLRIGISGVPGAGKSTFIEAFGLFLVKQGHKVAVLAVDPSSSVTRGSILGDKTRMEFLSREPNAFIRPSPSSGTLGGVTRKSRETILACEAAGYDIILVETVGVGQSEITVRSMVDFFLLVMIAGAGDELQGIKKGIIEIADALIVNKADGDNEMKANIARAEYSRVLHFLTPATRGWHTDAYTCSALTGAGIPEIWDVISKFREVATENGIFNERRKEQSFSWAMQMIEETLKDRFYHHPEVKRILHSISDSILHDKMLPTAAAEKLLRVFDGEKG